MRASCLPAATAAQVVPAATFQLVSSRRGLVASLAMAISDAVGKSSSPTWYVWKIAAVRPDFASQSFSAWSRGVEVKPPAAAPHRMLQVGTSLSVTVQVGAAGVAGAVEVAGVVAAAVVTVSVGRSG